MDRSAPEKRQSNHSLETILNQCWTAFRTGAEDANSPWHLPVVGTDGSLGAELRTIVVRVADEDRRSLVFHTDARSRKIKELEKSGQAAWLFFNPQSGVQIRARSQVTLHQRDDTARNLWEQVPLESRLNYSSALAPGNPVKDQPLRLLNDDEAFLNFMVVQCEVVFLDWLQISEDGHQRAQFNWDGHAWNGARVAP